MHTAAPARFAVAAAAAAALMLTALASPVLGHAALVTSDPADGAVLGTSPTTITLTFDDDLDGAKSSFKLVGPSASSVVGAVTPDNLKVMTATGVALDPGAWQIQWTAFSTDGHLTRGTVSFTISAPTAPPTTAPAATAAATAKPAVTPAVTPAGTPAPTAAPTPAAADSANGSSVVAAIVGGLALIGVAAWFLMRRNRG